MVAVISPFAFCERESMNDSELPSAVGSATAVWTVLKSAAFFPESTMLPFPSSPAKLPAVALVTLSALLPESPVTSSITVLTAFGVAAASSAEEFVALDSLTFFLVAEILPLESWDTVSMNSMDSVVPLCGTVGEAVVRSAVVTSPSVVVTTDRSAVEPTFPSLVMFPCVWPAVAKSDALLPESVRLPLESSPAKLPEVAELTLSALSASMDVMPRFSRAASGVVAPVPPFVIPRVPRTFILTTADEPSNTVLVLLLDRRTASSLELSSFEAESTCHGIGELDSIGVTPAGRPLLEVPSIHVTLASSKYTLPYPNVPSGLPSDSLLIPVNL